MFHSFVFAPLELVSGVTVVLWGINLLLEILRVLVQLKPLASPAVVHYFCWFIFVPQILE